MDDDESGPHCFSFSGVSASEPSAGQRVVLGRGRYQEPSLGRQHLWIRDGGSYTGLVVRDMSAKTDICKASFNTPVRAASSTNGRRTNTTLPDEDLALLKEECSSSHFSMEITGGSVLSGGSCVPNPCTFQDLETALGMRCDWETIQKHRLLQSRHMNKVAMYKTQTQTQTAVVRGSASASAGLRDREDSALVPARSSLAGVGAAGAFSASASAGCQQGPVQSQSPIDCLLGNLESALGHNEALMSQLTSLKAMLKVSKGTQKRRFGARGFEYQPKFMLNSVLLSDRLKVLDEMGDAIKEFLATVGGYFLLWYWL